MAEREGAAEQVIRAFQQLVESGDWDERRRILHATPLLMTDGGQQVVRRVADSADQAGEPEFARTVRSFAALVERCRQMGIDAALDEAQTALLTSLLIDFVNCHSWADSYYYLMDHADLRSPRAPDVLADMARRVQAGGHDDDAKIFRAHERLLRRVHEVGPESAFLEVGGEDFLSGMRFHAERGS